VALVDLLTFSSSPQHVEFYDIEHTVGCVEISRLGSWHDGCVGDYVDTCIAVEHRRKMGK
jgi:hypothetical protein